MSESRVSFRFGDFELDVAAYELRRKGRAVRLERQPMDVLILLVERRGVLVSRQEIADRLWGKDVFVDVDTGVHTAVRKIRQVLRDSREAPSFVETVSGKGYRFIAAVDLVPTAVGQEAAVVAPPPATSQSSSHPPAAQLTAAIPGAAAAVGSSRRWTIGRTASALGVMAVVIVCGMAGMAWLRRQAPVSHIRLAVLPFENLSGEQDREYLADGLAEETIASIGQIDPGRLSVIGRTSIMVYKRTTKSLAEIGRELGADYLVESSLRAEGAKLRVTSKLIRARDQVQVWSAFYDREPDSMLGLQRDLSTAIAEAVRVRLSPDRLTGIALRQTQNPEAYDAYLRARYFQSRRNPAANARAVEHFERAIELDPQYALAWSELSFTYGGSVLNGDARPADAALRARHAAARAVQANPHLAESQFVIGYVNWIFDWDWKAAEAAFRRATALDAGNAAAHRTLGHALSQAGRHVEAETEMRRSREVAPLEAINHALSSQVAFQARDYPAAVEHARRATRVDSEFWIGYMVLGQAYGEMGESDLALEALTDAARLSGANSKPVSQRGYLLAKAGRVNEAREVLRTLDLASRQRYVPPYAMALVYAGLGERDAVFAWLDRAYASRDVHLMYLPVDPKWDAYRNDPRFAALLARCGFLQATAIAAATY